MWSFTSIRNLSYSNKILLLLIGTGLTGAILMGSCIDWRLLIARKKRPANQSYHYLSLGFETPYPPEIPPLASVEEIRTGLENLLERFKREEAIHRTAQHIVYSALEGIAINVDDDQQKQVETQVLRRTQYNTPNSPTINYKANVIVVKALEELLGKKTFDDEVIHADHSSG